MLKNIPIINNDSIIKRRIIVLLVVKANIPFNIVSGSCSIVTIHINTEAEAIKNKVTTVPFIVSFKASKIDFIFMDLYIPPITNTYTITTAPASVAVNIPEKMPVNKIIGANNGKIELLKLLYTSFKEDLSSVGKSLGFIFAAIYIYIISEIPINIPGIIDAAKS